MATPLSITLAARDLTRHELARRAKCSPAWMTELVLGRGRPSAPLAQRIATVLDVDADDLFAEPAPDVIVSFRPRSRTA